MKNGKIKRKKAEYLIYGYIKDIKNIYIPNVISCLVYKFYNKCYHFNVYDVNLRRNMSCSGERIFINKDIILTDNNSALPNEYDRYFTNNSISVVSNGISNDNIFIYTKNKGLYCLESKNISNFGISLSGVDSLISPQMIKYPFDGDIKQISCGIDCSLFLTGNGSVYTGNASNNISKIMDNNVVKIGCCERSGFMLTNNYILYGTGNGISNLNGLNNPIKGTSNFNKIERITSLLITDFSCGGNHLGLLNKHTNQLLMIGQNNSYQCGIQSIFDVPICSGNFIKIHNESIINVKCGGQHTIIKVKHNKYYAFGSNNNHALLIEGFPLKSEPTLISNKYVKKFMKIHGKIIDYIPCNTTTYIIMPTFK